MKTYTLEDVRPMLRWPAEALLSVSYADSRVNSTNFHNEYWSPPMDIVLVQCPGDRRVLLCGGVLVYADGPDCRQPYHDAEWMAEQFARAAGVGVRVHRIQLPQDFAVHDEDGPLPIFTPEDVRDWWVAMCEAQAEEAAPPPAYPTPSE